MGLFGRRKEDIVPLPAVVTPKAIFDLNQIAERGAIALLGLFFGTMWIGVNNAGLKLATIESDIKTLPELKKEVSDLDEKIDKLATIESVKDLEGRIRALEIRK